MSYLIQKTISKGGFKYWADVALNTRGHEMYLSWEGLINNARAFDRRSVAENFMEMIDSEMKSTDNSELTIVEI